jgi:hypothetical protein
VPVCDGLGCVAGSASGEKFGDFIFDGIKLRGEIRRLACLVVVCGVAFGAHSSSHSPHSVMIASAVKSMNALAAFDASSSESRPVTQSIATRTTNKATPVTKFSPIICVAVMASALRRRHRRRMTMNLTAAARLPLLLKQSAIVPSCFGVYHGTALFVNRIAQPVV